MKVDELASPPSLRALFAQAVVAAPLPGRSAELPDRELVLDGVAIDRDHLARYVRVCGFALREQLPPTYPHVLAFPLALSLMADRRFPFPVLGLVHVENRIEQRRAVAASERLRLRVWAQDLRPHPRGRQFDVVSEAAVDGEPVWTEHSTYLRRGGGGEGGGGGENGGGRRGRRRRQPAPPEPSAAWKVPGDIGRRYAAVSGDANPIHMHGLTARLFGAPGAIAHGMWTLARSLAALESRLPPAQRSDARFRAPLRIPSTVRFGAAHEGDAWRFAVLAGRGEREHLVGTAGPL